MTSISPLLSLNLPFHFEIEIESDPPSINRSWYCSFKFMMERIPFQPFSKTWLWNPLLSCLLWLSIYLVSSFLQPCLFSVQLHCHCLWNSSLLPHLESLASLKPRRNFHFGSFYFTDATFGVYSLVQQSNSGHSKAILDWPLHFIHSTILVEFSRICSFYFSGSKRRRCWNS